MYLEHGFFILTPCTAEFRSKNKKLKFELLTTLYKYAITK